MTVVDDYAHHPTEIRATLAAARVKYPGRDLWAVFQPHTYTRTAALLEVFQGVWRCRPRDRDPHLCRREQETLGVGGQDIVSLMDQPDSQYLDTLDEAVLLLLEQVQAGDVVLTLGAGDGYLVGERLLELLKQRENDGTEQRSGAEPRANPPELRADGGCGPVSSLARDAQPIHPWESGYRRMVSGHWRESDA